MKGMMFAIFSVLLCAAAFASGADFTEKTLTTAGTEYSVGNLSSYAAFYYDQNGSNTWLNFSSNSTSDNQLVTINYYNASWTPKVLKLNLTNTTTVNTSQNYRYVPTNTTNVSVTYGLEYSTRAYWDAKSNGAGCFNFTNVTAFTTSSSANLSTNFTVTAASDLVQSDDGTTAFLINTTGGKINTTGTISSLTFYLNGVKKTITQNDYDAGWNLVNCTNMNFTSNVSTTNLNVTNYTRTGAKYSGNDIAYIENIAVNSTAVGNINFTNSFGRSVYMIPIGQTVMPNFGGIDMCFAAGGCSVNNIFASNDVTVRYKAKIRSVLNVTRTALTIYQPVGSWMGGSSMIKFKQGEWLEWYATGYTNNANVSLYYDDQ